MISSAKNILATLLYNTIYSKKTATILAYKAKFKTSTPESYRRIENYGGEKSQLQIFLQNLKYDDVVWDIGAFIGLYTIFAAIATSKGGRIYAFEPERTTANKLKENCRLNKLNNITILNYALSGVDAGGKIYPAKKGQNAIHSLLPHEGLNEDGVKIELAKGDSLVKSGIATIPNVIKMDIEGAELGALQGMIGVLNNPICRFLFLELHHNDIKRFGGTEEEVISLIQRAGFVIKERVRRGSESHLFCYK